MVFFGQRNFQAYKNLRLEKSSTDGYLIFLMGFSHSHFRDFESYLRIVAILDEDDIHLILKQHNSHFIT